MQYRRQVRRGGCLYCIYPKNYLVVVLVLVVMMNDSIVVYRYICKCVCVYVFTQVRVISISISISISIPISTYLPSVPQFLYLHQQKKHAPASIDHRFLFPPPRPTRAYACACACMCIYELMEGFSSLSSPVRTSPRPSAPLPPKKKKTFASAASPPSPCDGSSHIQSQLDKASYLPAKELRKK